MPSKADGARLDVAVEQRPDPDPERRDEFDPGLVKTVRQHIPCPCWVGQEGVQQATMLLIRHGLAATLEFALDLLRRGRLDLGELISQTRPRPCWRGRQEVWNVA